MVDTKTLANALNGLMEQEPKKESLTRKLRELLPQINDAMAAGHSRKAIHQTLRDAGLDISFTSYVTILSRIRNELNN